MGSNIRKFTLEELKQYDGQKGRPAYIGKVYDVTDNYTWGDGSHYGEHQAGQDVTDGMSDAPHGEDKLEATVLVGEITG